MAWRMLAFLPLVLWLAGCKTNGETSGLASDEAGAPIVAAVTPVASVLEDFKNKSADELYVIFRDAKGDGQIPLGHGTGYPILMANASTLNNLANKIWGGSEFKKDASPSSNAPIITVKNFVGPLTIIRGRVISGKISDARSTLADSLIDDKPSIVLNYGDAEMGTVTPFNKIVDEIRLVNPATQLYLGRAFMAETFVCYFALQFTE